MKKLISIAAILAFTIGTTAFAGGERTNSYSTLQKSYDLSFFKIVVEDDIDLVLYENFTTNIQFDGSKESIDQVDWKIKKGVLYIKSKRGSLKNKVILTLDVNNLKDITINGSSKVRSLGYLNSSLLNVHMNGSGYVALRNNGRIVINNAGDTEMDVKTQSGDILFSTELFK